MMKPFGRRISIDPPSASILILVAIAFLSLAHPGPAATQCYNPGPNPFGSPVSYPTGAGPVAVVAGDFNGDGKPDLAVSNNSDNSVTVLLGNGDGTFPSSTTTTVAAPGGLAAGDFNGDGKLDLAVTNAGPFGQFGFTGTTVTVLLGNGDGTFTLFATPSVFTGPVSIVTADFNGDGILDLAVATTTYTSVSVLVGDGRGNFGSEQFSFSFATSDDTSALVVGDFNADGWPDLAVTTGSGSQPSGIVGILLNSSVAGLYLSFAASSFYAVPGNAQAMAAADFNRDGQLDLAVADAQNNAVYFSLSNGSGDFGPAASFPTTGSRPISLAVADFDGDGYFDLVEANADTPSVGLTFDPDGSTYCVPVAIPVGSSTANLRSMAAGDFNGDGKPDLAVAAFGDNSLYVLLNETPGNSNANTPVGSNITVQPVDTATNTSPATVTFGSVTIPGTTTLATSATGPAIPDSFQLGSPPTYYELATTAIYDGSLQVCINYSGINFNDPSQLSIWRYSGSSWSQLPTAINSATTTVCASTPSLSSFAILGPANTTPPINDTTPPVINSHVSGPLGLNGWYVGQVNVGWNVVDPESAIATSSGCEFVTLSTDTPGTTLTCTATNGAGLSSSVSVVIKIDASRPNPPTAVLSPLANPAGWNNAATTLSFMANGDVGPSGIASCTPPTTLSAETAGATQSGVCVDAAGNTSFARFVTVRIDETVPVTSDVLANPNPIPINTSATLSATVDDPGSVASGVALAQYNINGGAFSPMNGPFPQTSASATAATPAFAATGLYTACVSTTDVAGNPGAASCIPLAVYDPTGGFVTGVGWIQSPAGAFAADPSLTGKANFGFVSKYQKGASIPTGQTQFQFQVANLTFKSTSYDWLVVAGARAQFKGSGTINGAGDYGFLLTAIDGQINGGGGEDRFRIKIWDKSTGAVVYDNQMGSSDTGNDATALGGGSIIIHGS